ncbi:MAG TPA: four helix bundle protein [Bacteroidota bacterium]|nr:four helix bundle protein [Bacteroidota bacterium]
MIGAREKTTIKSFRDLKVYQHLFALHLEVNELTLKFPKHEMYELGSQLRRSSNSIPANLAEGWNSKHLNIYLEGLNRAQGELRETDHHLDVAHRKGYLPKDLYESIRMRYEECGKMLSGLEQSLIRIRSERTK